MLGTCRWGHAAGAGLGAATAGPAAGGQPFGGELGRQRTPRLVPATTAGALEDAGLGTAPVRLRLWGSDPVAATLWPRAGTPALLRRIDGATAPAMIHDEI